MKRKMLSSVMDGPQEEEYMHNICYIYMFFHSNKVVCMHECMCVYTCRRMYIQVDMLEYAHECVCVHLSVCIHMCRYEYMHNNNAAD